jgi:hypothetical protein
MKRSKFSEERLGYSLRQVESGTPQSPTMLAVRCELRDLSRVEEQIRALGPSRLDLLQPELGRFSFRAARPCCRYR